MTLFPNKQGEGAAKGFNKLKFYSLLSCILLFICSETELLSKTQFFCYKLLCVEADGVPSCSPSYKLKKAADSSKLCMNQTTRVWLLRQEIALLQSVLQSPPKMRYHWYYFSEVYLAFFTLKVLVVGLHTTENVILLLALHL